MLYSRRLIMSKTKVIFGRIFPVLIAVLLTGFIIGCNSTPTAPSPDNFSLIMRSAINSSTSGNGATNVLNLKSVKITLTEAELIPIPSKRVGISETPQIILDAPEAINLNLNGSKNIISFNKVKPGLYSGVKFIISGLDNGITPNIFNESTGPFPNKECSVIVSGSYFNRSFTFKSINLFEQVVQFSSPISVQANGVADVTLKVNPYSWFYKDGEYLDPSLHQNASAINNMISMSFKNVLKENPPNVFGAN